MPNVLIRDVPDQVVDALKLRAAARRRSMQQEVLEILEHAANETSAADVAAGIRDRLTRLGIDLGESGSLIRADRER